MDRFIEQQYLEACRRCIEHGHDVPNERTGTGTRMLTNVYLEHGDVECMFPLPITKKLATKSMIGELLWFLEGSTSDRRLAEITYGDGDHETIWTANWRDYYARTGEHASAGGSFDRDLGPVYGVQWSGFGGRNQIVNVIERIKTTPTDRRLVVTAWNPGAIDKMALPPCHMIFQFNVVGKKLDLLMMQRSGDAFLGVPFNIASYALLMKIVAKECNLVAGKLSIVIGNFHIYTNHFDQMKEQVSRMYSQSYIATQFCYRSGGREVPLPSIQLNNTSNLFNDDGSIGYKLDDFTVVGYEPLPSIKGAMSV